jgi:hypothetical protein
MYNPPTVPSPTYAVPAVPAVYAAPASYFAAVTSPMSALPPRPTASSFSSSASSPSRAGLSSPPMRVPVRPTEAEVLSDTDSDAAPEEVRHTVYYPPREFASAANMAKSQAPPTPPHVSFTSPSKQTRPATAPSRRSPAQPTVGISVVPRPTIMPLPLRPSTAVGPAPVAAAGEASIAASGAGPIPVSSRPSTGRSVASCACYFG